jgi:hypothetical protein
MIGLPQNPISRALYRRVPPHIRLLPSAVRRRPAGNGRKPTSVPPQLGRWIVAPLWPQAVQRAERRSLSLEVSAPHRITATAQASGDEWEHFSQ